MRLSRAMTVALTMAVAAGGCVSKETYQAAVRESEDVKADLDRERTQTKALEQHVKNLQEQSGKLASEAQLAAAEVQRLKDSASPDRTGVDSRIKELDVKLREMAGQNRQLIAQTEELRKRNRTLEAHVTRAQHELKEQPRAGSAMGGPGAGTRPAPKSSAPAAVPPPPARSMEAAPPLSGPGSAAAPAPAQPPKVAGAQPAPGQPAPAPGGPQGAKPAEPPQEDLSLIAKIKRWLSSIWHLFF